MSESLGLGTRLRHAWNTFLNRNPTQEEVKYLGQSSYSRRPDRIRFSYGNERTITSAIYTRIGIDVSAFRIVHARIDRNARFKEIIESGLNYCLTVEANIDQTGRGLIQDIVMSLCDEGVVAVIAVDTTHDPKKIGSYEINSLRTGKIKEWFPRHIRVEAYNDRNGRREDIILPKEQVAIIENPLYSVMNEPNSTLRRLIHKLSLLDVIDSQSGSGKLDLILQLPYAVKSKSRKEQAEERRQDIEEQLVNSKYGIAYTDGTEKITQLNRPVENNLLKQIELLMSLLYNQLGISEEILSGTANEQAMLNYHNRTLEPMIAAITNELNRTFITKTARTQGQRIMSFNEPFKLVPLINLAEIADKFTRNEILSSNEIRSIIGFAPSEDPGADELRNKNLNQPALDKDTKSEGIKQKEEGDNQNGI